ncbi:MAG: hypothetical protein HKN03_03460 [Acidimicrobiales bacterium]|nr:hypothetical protein [Acidimicrobiales bacterium]
MLVLWGSQPALSQEGNDEAVPTNDSLGGDGGNGQAEAIDTLGLATASPSELAALRAAAHPKPDLDPWRNGTSAVDGWKLAASANLAAQTVELRRLEVETQAARARVEVSIRSHASTVNRDEVIETRLTALIVDSFMNSEADALDKLNGQNATLYVAEPIEAATETLTALKVRSSAAIKQSAKLAVERSATAADTQALAVSQLETVDEATSLDRSAQIFGMDHVSELRRREARTLQVSGEAPEVVPVGTFMVSPTIAASLRAMLAAAAAAGTNVEVVEEAPSIDGADLELVAEPQAPPQPIILEGWGYRSTEEQIDLRMSHCGPSAFDIFDGPSPACQPPTARPLHSEHEKGLAVDITENGAILNSTSPGFAWLQANAATYGFFNLPSEPWHWSTTGH